MTKQKSSASLRQSSSFSSLPKQQENKRTNILFKSQKINISRAKKIVISLCLCVGFVSCVCMFFLSQLDDEDTETLDASKILNSVKNAFLFFCWRVINFGGKVQNSKIKEEEGRVNNEDFNEEFKNSQNDKSSNGNENISFFVYDKDSVQEVLHVHRRFYNNDNMDAIYSNHMKGSKKESDIDGNEDMYGTCLKKKEDETHIINSSPFTQGLFLTGCETAIESAGLYGGSFLREFHITSGQTLRHVKLNEKYFGEGATMLWYFYTFDEYNSDEDEENKVKENSGEKEEKDTQEKKRGMEEDYSLQRKEENMWEKKDRIRGAWNLADIFDDEKTDEPNENESTAAEREKDEKQEKTENSTRVRRNTRKKIEEEIKKKAVILQLTWFDRKMLVYDYENFELIEEFYFPLVGWGVTSNFELNLSYHKCNEIRKRKFEHCIRNGNQEGMINDGSVLHCSDEYKNNFIAKERNLLEEVEEEEEEEAKRNEENKKQKEKREGQQKNDIDKEEEKKNEKLTNTENKKNNKSVRIWATTGDSFLYELELPPLDISYFVKKKKNSKMNNNNNNDRSSENISKSSNIKEVKIKKKTKLTCLGVSIPSINELEYHSESNTIFANFFGSFLMFEFDVDTGKCKSVISLGGLYNPASSHVKKHYDIPNDVMNGITFLPSSKKKRKKK